MAHLIRLVVVAVVVLSALLFHAQAADYSNPLAWYLDDPFVTFADGYYYFMYTNWDTNDIRITRSTTLDGLKTGQTKVVLPDSGVTFEAPELHKIDGIWWIYFAAPNPDIDAYPRTTIYALKGGPSPRDPFTYAGQLINTTTATYPTILRLPSFPNPYLLYSCTFPSTRLRTSLCISSLSSPTDPGPPIILANATASWELPLPPVHPNISEITHPSVLHHPATNRTYIAYTPGPQADLRSYPLGLLLYTGSGKDDPLLASSWTKSGPYHMVAYNAGADDGTTTTPCNVGQVKFFASPDGEETWAAYSASDAASRACVDSDEWYHVGVKRVRFTRGGGDNDDGMVRVDFGGAAPVGEMLPGPGGE